MLLSISCPIRRLSAFANLTISSPNFDRPHLVFFARPGIFTVHFFELAAV